MNYRLIQQLQQKAIPVQHSCRVLAVSRAGYYAARQRVRRPLPACATSVHLQSAFEASGRCYGSRRLQGALNDLGLRIGRYRVRSLMRAHQLKPVWKRKFVHTTDSKHNQPVFDNVLNRQFEQPAELVCTALQMALCQRRPSPGLIVHSDRGSQYASQEYRHLLDRHGLIGSMSRKGNCWDNAVMERFFLNLKMERVWRRDYANHQEAINDVTDYIVGFYNSQRSHSTLGYRPPNVYEQEMAAGQPILVSEKT